MGEKSRFTIQELLGVLPRKQRQLLKCPFHHDETPSLSVNFERQLWYCFSCGIGGTAKDLAKRLGKDVESEEKRFSEAYWDALSIRNINAVVDFLFEKRYNSCEHITKENLAEVIIAYGIVLLSDVKLEKTEQFSGVLYPMQDWTGNIVGYQSWSPERKPKYKSKFTRGLVRPMTLESKSPVCVVDGAFDAFAGYICGMDCVATCGANATDEQIFAISRLATGKKIIIFPDKKKEDICAWYRVAKKLSKMHSSVFIANYKHYRHKDIDEHLVSGDIDLVFKAYNEAAPFKEWEERIKDYVLGQSGNSEKRA